MENTDDLLRCGVFSASERAGRLISFVATVSIAFIANSIFSIIFLPASLNTGRGASSLLIGTVQTLAVAFDYSVMSVLQQLNLPVSAALRDNSLARLTIAQVAPILPYLLLVLILIFRPRGLLGNREG
jgi:branched-chain amino acid transport system permease protein